MDVGQLLSLLCVSIFWGVTNPFMGRGGKGINNIKKSGFLSQFVAELQFLFLNWRYVLPFLINQLGSVFFYYTLSTSELSITVPLTNGLTFLFTSVTGQCLGEHPESKKTYLGMGCVVLGVTLCLTDKMANS